METTNLATLYGAEPLDWQPVADRLDHGVTLAPGTGGPDRHSTWLATLNADGSPHLTVVGALWDQGSFWFETGPVSRKARNLDRDPRATMTPSVHEFDLSVRGTVERVTDPDDVARLAEHWSDDGWPVEVDESGVALTALFSAQSAGPPPWFVYRLTPSAATVVQTVEPHGATRWTF